MHFPVFKAADVFHLCTTNDIFCYNESHQSSSQLCLHKNNRKLKTAIKRMLTVCMEYECTALCNIWPLQKWWRTWQGKPEAHSSTTPTWWTGEVDSHWCLLKQTRYCIVLLNNVLLSKIPKYVCWHSLFFHSGLSLLQGKKALANKIRNKTGRKIKHINTKIHTLSTKILKYVW